MSELRQIKTFKPLPWQVEPFRDTSPVLLLTGSAGGGKSFLSGNKIHGYCLKYPGATALVLRKERATLSNSTILMFEREVVGSDPRVNHVKSEFRFEYDNGSILVYGGMKDPSQRERIRSIGQKGGLDIVWMEEATQFTEQDFNEVLARMRGRAAPWRQIILSTNPDAPSHWINVKLILGGGASVYYSSATDNDYNPDSYIDSLEMLSGVQYQRLVEGMWTAGSGQIIDTWEDSYNPSKGKDFGGNVTDDAEYVDGAGPVIWAVDDGYSGKIEKATGMFTGNSHPRAIMLAQEVNGQIRIFAESYKIKTLARDHIKEVVELSKKNGWAMPSYVVRDRAAASIGGVLEDKFGFSTVFNTVPVNESIKEFISWSAPDDNGVRRVIAHPRCSHFRYEIASYSYDSKGKIMKQHDNGVDAVRYLIWNQEYGDIPIVDIATIDRVIDRGY